MPTSQNTMSATFYAFQVPCCVLRIGVVCRARLQNPLIFAVWAILVEICSKEFAVTAVFGGLLR